MTFTYVLANAIGQVRFELGDTDSSRALFSDEEITYRLTANGSSVLVTAASLCEVLARKYARDVDFSMDGQSVSASQKSKAYTLQAAELRKRAGQSMGSVVTTKIDGYSDTVLTPPNATDRDTRGRGSDFEVGRFD